MRTPAEIARDIALLIVEAQSAGMTVALRDPNAKRENRALQLGPAPAVVWDSGRPALLFDSVDEFDFEEEEDGDLI